MTTSPSPPPVSPASLPLSRKKVLIVASLVVFLLVAVSLGGWFFWKKKGNSKQVTLTYWGLFEPSSVFQQVIADYEKSHPGIKINYSQENLKDYRERLLAALARQGSGTKTSEGVALRESPDIFRFHQTWVPMLSNYLSPLPANVYDAATFEKTFYPSARESLRHQGQYVGIPLETDGLALFYNENLLKAAGVTPPRTWEELKNAACKLTVRDEQGKIITAGVALGTTNNVDFWSDILGLMLLQNGVNLANPAYCTQESGSALAGGEVCLGRDALAFYAVFATDQACLSENGFNPGPVWDETLPASTYAFATGKLAMFFGPSWSVFEIQKLNPTLKMKVIPVPQLEGKKINWASFWVEGVSKNSKYQAEAWDFLKYLSSKEVLQKLYQAESALRGFGEPYSRMDMADLLMGQPYVSAFIEQAPTAQSWYLSSRTGDNGLNDQIIKYYEDAVNAVVRGKDPLSALKTTSQGVSQILRQYGLAR